VVTLSTGLCILGWVKITIAVVFLLAIVFFSAFLFACFLLLCHKHTKHTFPAFILLCVVFYIMWKVQTADFLLHNHTNHFQFCLLSLQFPVSLVLCVCVCGQTENTGMRWGECFCLLGNSGKSHLRMWCYSNMASVLCWHRLHQTLSRPVAAGILSVTLHISQLTHTTERASGWASPWSIMRCMQFILVRKFQGETLTFYGSS